MIRSGQTRVKAPRKERAIFKEIKKREDLQKSSLFLYNENPAIVAGFKGG